MLRKVARQTGVRLDDMLGKLVLQERKVTQVPSLAEVLSKEADGGMWRLSNPLSTTDYTLAEVVLKELERSHLRI